MQSPQLFNFYFNLPNQVNPVMHSEAKVKTFSSPKSVSSLEALTDYASATFDMISTSPSMTSMTEERRDGFENEKLVDISRFVSDFGEADSYCQETKKPFKILRQSKKIVKEEVQPKNQNLSKENKRNQRSRKNGWKEEEDIKLRKLFDQFGPQWTKIGTMMGNKTGKQVRDRYMNASRPDISYAEWTEEEDKLFLSLLNKYGKKWCQIASEMPGRTDNQVKNKFYCLRRDRKKNNQRRNELRNAIQGIENADTNDTNSEISESKSQEHNSAGYYDDVNEYFEFNQSAQLNDDICFENKMQDGQSDYIPQPFKHISLQNNGISVFFD